MLGVVVVVAHLEGEVGQLLLEVGAGTGRHQEPCRRVEGGALPRHIAVAGCDAMGGVDRRVAQDEEVADLGRGRLQAIDRRFARSHQPHPAASSRFEELDVHLGLPLHIAAPADGGAQRHRPEPGVEPSALHHPLDQPGHRVGADPVPGLHLPQLAEHGPVEFVDDVDGLGGQVERRQVDAAVTLDPPVDGEGAMEAELLAPRQGVDEGGGSLRRRRSERRSPFVVLDDRERWRERTSLVASLMPTVLPLVSAVVAAVVLALLMLMAMVGTVAMGRRGRGVSGRSGRGIACRWLRRRRGRVERSVALAIASPATAATAPTAAAATRTLAVLALLRGLAFGRAAGRSIVADRPHRADFADREPRAALRSLEEERDHVLAGDAAVGEEGAGAAALDLPGIVGLDHHVVAVRALHRTDQTLPVARPAVGVGGGRRLPVDQSVGIVAGGDRHATVEDPLGEAAGEFAVERKERARKHVWKKGGREPRGAGEAKGIAPRRARRGQGRTKEGPNVGKGGATGKGDRAIVRRGRLARGVSVRRPRSLAGLRGEPMLSIASARSRRFDGFRSLPKKEAAGRSPENEPGSCRSPGRAC